MNDSSISSINIGPLTISKTFRCGNMYFFLDSENYISQVDESMIESEAEER